MPKNYRLTRQYKSGHETTHTEGPVVIPGKDIEEVTLCNVAAEPCMRIQIPEGGMLIVRLRQGASNGTSNIEH